MDRYISFAELLSQIVYAEKIECYRQVWKDGSAWEGYYTTPRYLDGLSFICSSVEVTYELPDGKKLFAGQGDVVYVPRGSRYRISFRNGGKGTDIYTINFILMDREGRELRFGQENYYPIRQGWSFFLLIGIRMKEWAGMLMCLN